MAFARPPHALTESVPSHLLHLGNDNPILPAAQAKNLAVTLSFPYAPHPIYWEILLVLTFKYD